MRRLSLNHVHDNFIIQEGEEKIRIRVDAEVTELARSVKEALALVELAKKKPERAEEADMAFSRAMFGETQTKQILDLYNGNTLSVLEISARAFTMRLARKIEKAQRRMK